MSWTPKHREPVIAVLPDGHEIEGEYDCPINAEDVADGAYVRLGRGAWLTIDPSLLKPVPVEEPKTFGACVKDWLGARWIRDGEGDWLREDCRDRTWLELVRDHGPLTVVNADPWSES